MEREKKSASGAGGVPARERATESLLEELVERAPRASRGVGVLVAVLLGLDPDGAPLLKMEGADKAPLVARSLVALTPSDIGRDAVVAFEGGDPESPVILGLIAAPAARAAESVSVELDGDRITLTAEREVVLRCGKASLTLTRAGKVLIRGDYVLSRSSGVNRIKGGSVQIN